MLLRVLLGNSSRFKAADKAACLLRTHYKLKSLSRAHLQNMNRQKNVSLGEGHFQHKRIDCVVFIIDIVITGSKNEKKKSTRAKILMVNHIILRIMNKSSINYASMNYYYCYLLLFYKIDCKNNQLPGHRV